MKKILISLFIALGVVLGAAPPGHAVTIDEVIALAQSGTQDGLILTKIDADQTVFQLTVDEILALQKAGVSDNVITYMINTGKSLHDDSEDAATEEKVYTDVEDDGAENEVEEDNADGSWAAGLNYSNVGFGISVGYYYPSWPGYYYSSYYDPFFWDGWGYYYSYWAPYPYWRWYDGVFACYPYSYGYWDAYSTPYPYYGGHQGYGYVHDGYYERNGRYAGSRGSVRRGSRRDGYRGGDSDALMANNRLIEAPRRPGTRIVKKRAESAPGRGYDLRRPSVRKQKTQRVETARRAPDRGVRVSPGARARITPKQPATDVRRRPKSTKPARIKQPALKGKPVKVQPARKGKIKKDGHSKKQKSRQVAPRRRSRPSTPHVSPAPRQSSRPAPARRAPSSRRGRP